MNTSETNEIRELTASGLEQVTGGLGPCASGVHYNEATVSTREGRTPVGYFGGIPIY
jgi:hypothetical protein